MLIFEFGFYKAQKAIVLLKEHRADAHRALARVCKEAAP
jgi:hypothetical protein